MGVLDQPHAIDDVTILKPGGKHSEYVQINQIALINQTVLREGQVEKEINGIFRPFLQLHDRISHNWKQSITFKHRRKALSFTLKGITPKCIKK